MAGDGGTGKPGALVITAAGTAVAEPTETAAAAGGSGAAPAALAAAGVIGTDGSPLPLVR